MLFRWVSFIEGSSFHNEKHYSNGPLMELKESQRWWMVELLLKICTEKANFSSKFLS